MSAMRLRELGRHVAEREDALLADLQPSASTRQSVAEHAARRRPPPRVVRRRLVVAVAAAAAAAVLLLFVLGLVGRARAPLTFTIEGPRPAAGVLKEWVSTPAAGSRSLRFSDGSRIVLGAQARARVVRLSAEGADLDLEAGRANVNVTHRGGGDWRIRSGPFVVEVTGTRFEVSFSPQTGEFELELHEGRVRVSGCGLGNARVVATGETFKASCSEHLPAAATTSAAPATASPPVAPAAVLSAPTVSGKSAGATPSAPPRSAPRASILWTELAREGRYQAAYELAKEAGFEGECERRNAEELVLLGDTARLVSEGRDAERAYRAVRQRFPGSAAAVRAAYALGTLEARSGQHAAAVRWYELSFAEQPSGPFSATALGRMLESLVKLGERKKLERVATTYLERYPAGAHAEEARRVLNSVPAAE